MVKIKAVHHIAIICSNYDLSKKFYTEILGFSIVAEHYRETRNSFKLDLALGGRYLIELFSFPSPPDRVSMPEVCGLRHLAFEVEDITAAVTSLLGHGIVAESIRVDEYTGKRFTFFEDPDHLPLELYER
jgi:glyoxylase I family protein